MLAHQSWIEHSLVNLSLGEDDNIVVKSPFGFELVERTSPFPRMVDLNPPEGDESSTVPCQVPRWRRLSLFDHLMQSADFIGVQSCSGTLPTTPRTA